MTKVRFLEEAEVQDIPSVTSTAQRKSTQCAQPYELQKRQRTQASSPSSSSNQLPLPVAAATDEEDLGEAQAPKNIKPQGWWVHGHRAYNQQQFGITKENATVGRARGGQGRGRETPQQEQNRLQGIANTNPHITGPVSAKAGKAARKIRKEDSFPMDQMTCLMDSLWDKRKKWGTDHSNFWAVANQISAKYRPSYHQVDRYDWDDSSRNPYPGWKVAIRHTSSGWKVAVMTNAEHATWSTEHSQPSSKAAQARQKELHPTGEDRKSRAMSSEDLKLTGQSLQPGTASQLRDVQEREAGNPMAVKSEDVTEDISPYKVAMHRWQLFANTACDELSGDFSTAELQEIKKHFAASGFGANRNNLPALVKDIQECQKIQEILAQRKETQAEMRRIDPALALRQDKLAHVFEDVLNIKRRQHKKCVRKQNKDTTAVGLHCTMMTQVA